MLQTNVEVFTSSTWMTIKENINDRIHVAINKLTHAKNWDDVCRFKGQIEALRSVVALDFNDTGDYDA